ncbi:molecular chaperone [Pseudomonas sp. NBRC 111130]|uniref:fimbrial biogenesis chaperone n=1 Tax=Pseudomonas sp. NBRC 111130 TaxID=1661045 RepID=UPI0006D40713|nr:molecular chaperone [Pseudomonas sp. NBRC 111130]
MHDLISVAPRARAAVAACLTGLWLAISANTSQAALTLSNTRIVHESDKRSTSIVVRNPSAQAFAVQAWVNTEADDNTSPVPLLPSPQLFSLAPGNEQLLQLNALPNDLPDDRESLFYLNVQEIPQAEPDQANALSIALRTRLKVFYRPHSIKGTPARQIDKLQFTLGTANGGVQLLVNNPTPFHITFSHLKVSDSEQTSMLKNPAMVAPLSTMAYPLDIRPRPPMKVTFGIINDFGGYTTPTTRPVTLEP